MTGTFKRRVFSGPALVLALSFLVFVFAHRQALDSPYVINDDARQQLYWMASWRDGDLYPPSLLSEYAKLYVPAGVKAVYRAAAVFADPLQASKAVTGALFMAFCLAMYGLGRTLGGERLGFAAAAASWLMPYFLYNISGGLSRAFAAPLMAMFLLAWVRRKGSFMGLVLLLQAVCIPYICILCCLACGLAWGGAVLTKKPLPPFPRRIFHVIALLACVLAVYSMQQEMDASGFGPLVGIADMLGRPEFGPLGRLDLFPLPNPFFDLIYWPFERIGLFLDSGLFAGIASLVLLALPVVYGARRFPWKTLGPHLRPFAFLGAASLMLYILARMFALKLFVPDRYVSYSINIFYALALAACFTGALGRFLSRRGAGAALLVLAAVLGAIRLSGAGLYDYSSGAPVYQAARELPKDAIIAGHPEDMDNVLTFGRRNVQASFELAHPWSKGYWELYEPRLKDVFEAYYASDPREVRAFCEKYGVTHILVDAARFTPEFMKKSPFFAPFDARIRELAANAGRFALLDAANFPYRVIAPGVRLVEVNGKTDGETTGRRDNAGEWEPGAPGRGPETPEGQ